MFDLFIICLPTYLLYYTIPLVKVYYTAYHELFRSKGGFTRMNSFFYWGEEKVYYTNTLINDYMAQELQCNCNHLNQHT